MLKRGQRLRRSRDFARLYQKGRFAGSKHMALRSNTNNQPTTRIGVVISKKTLKSAVARNRAKRRITEQLRLIYPQLKTGYDCVVIVKQDIVALKPAELAAELKQLLTKSGVVQ